MDKFYVVSRQYTGSNEGFENSFSFFVTNEAPRTNSSKEVKTSGWLGTSNGWQLDAHGEFDSLERAIDEINKIIGDDQRSQEDYDNDEVDESDKPLYITYVGAFPTMNKEATENFVYQAMLDEIDGGTTDEGIFAFIKACNEDAKKELRMELNWSHADSFVTSHRDAEAEELDSNSPNDQ